MAADDVKGILASHVRENKISAELVALPIDYDEFLQSANNCAMSYWRKSQGNGSRRFSWIVLLIWIKYMVVGWARISVDLGKPLEKDSGKMRCLMFGGTPGCRKGSPATI